MKTLLPEIDSPDKRFHAGNPATGEQGTRVTDTWLNDVQDSVRDVQAEAHYVLLKAGFTPRAETQTQLYQAIVKIIDDNRKSASTTQKGEVRLTSDTGLDSEELGLTAKAGRKLAQMIAVVQLALNNYIPLNKRSSVVNSNDENNVATSKAVKTAYDKGVEAKSAADAAQTSATQAKSSADAAQRTANDANNNANTRQLKSELVGEVAFFARSTPPSGWLKANGATVSRTTYAALFDAIGTTFGAGDGRTTFNLPDLRGEFIRGLDDGRNVDGSRRLGSPQGDAIKTHTITVPNSGFEGRVQGSWFYAESGNGNNNQKENTITYNGENETRPRNIALLACIKY
jgi:probable tail fiber protein|nr:MAG TPA: tail collar fiber protein [Caudoviricetes sp.]